ncbi:hypothetical protein M758_3G212700 [Ceratodon purpureus]|nr:hypothetical protein M758_3G212700 [Ceratodon purpureus]
MEHPSGSEEVCAEVNADGMEKLDSYLELAKGCMEAVQKMSSPKFNNEQIRYLADKLSTVVKSAGLFSEMLRCNQHGAHSSSDHVEKWVEIYKLVLALAKQIESFVQGCCRDAWVEAAMTLSDVGEYVSSLGFNLELCRVVFREGQCGAMHCGLTLVEVDGINKAEVESVKQKASMDKDSILKKVTLELDSSDLAKYLLQRLVRVHPGPTPKEGNRMGRLFDWVISGSKPKQLGRGASATVYKVMWLGTPVAKKTFFGSGNVDFLKEVDILSRLHHPNIMSMFCSTMNKKNCSIIMELMDGDLFSLMERRCEENSDSPPFSISEAIDIMLQVAEGVNYLHTKGIVHRDLKSMNILVKRVKALELETGYVQAKVMDFGLSKTKERSATFSNMTYNQGTWR